MRASTVSAKDVAAGLRLDSKYHLSKHNPLLQELALSGFPTRSIGDLIGNEKVWCGNIFTRVYASDEKHGKPLLSPYDVFRYLPWSDKVLSSKEVPQFNRLRVTRGSLLIVCSGRNLGPATIADSFCERFVLSHDMIRIDGALSDELFYIAGFLNTDYGQALIRTDMNGSVIDHTDAPAVRALRIPILPSNVRSAVVEASRAAFLLRERARLEIDDLKREYSSHFGIDELDRPYADKLQARTFTINAASLGRRLDAEPHSPQYQRNREVILSLGGRRLGDVASIKRPSARYKTSYVQDISFGIPLLNGRQVAQYRPIAVKLMNVSGFKSPEAFTLSEGMTLLTADGRAEENLADCVLVTKERAGWGASGHVHRIIPHDADDSGLIYLACSSAAVQAQLKALATGSVVDALSEDDVASVIIPYEKTEIAKCLGRRAVVAWEKFAEAFGEERRAIVIFEDAIRAAALS